jgi:uncharacterized protein YbjT (DUF2867 family)
MNIIQGASGQVGSAIVTNLVKKGEPVKGIVRSKEKAEQLKKKGADSAIADVFDQQAITEALEKGSTLFVITPETGKGDDILGDTKKSLQNIRKAIEKSPVKKVVGLSSIGAQYDKGTGNLLMSYFLEHAFKDLDIEQSYIRPAYYYSNWMAYLPVVKESGILPTFFPVDLSIPMISPMDVAKFATDIITNDDSGNKIYEASGPASVSSAGVAEAFSKALHKDVKAKQIPRDQWPSTLKKIGFSEDAIKNYIEMTDMVISGRIHAENQGTVALKGKTTLQEYINSAVN